MNRQSSRRCFLAAGLAAPSALATTQVPQKPTPSAALTLLPKDSVKLEFRTLGKTGLKVTSVGFGTMITSDGTVIERAADIGINYFDTARGYQEGNCEKMVGAALKGKRQNLVLSTKSHTRSKDGALADLDKSLQELGTDYVDIWYMHGVGKPEEINDGVLEAVDLAKKSGKARFTGVSTHAGHEQVIPFVAANRKHFDVLLASYNFAMDRALGELLGDAQQAGLGVVAMKVMAGGSRRLNRPGADPKVKAILAREGAMLVALKWVLNNRSVHTTIPSITDMDQLDDNLKAMALPFSLTDKKLLEARLEELRPWYCRMCGKCEGTCAKGLPVEDMLRYMMYAETYGEFSLGREHFKLLPAETAAVRCSDCTGCTVQCPYGVRVAERLSLCQECLA